MVGSTFLGEIWPLAGHCYLLRLLLWDIIPLSWSLLAELLRLNQHRHIALLALSSLSDPWLSLEFALGRMMHRDVWALERLLRQTILIETHLVLAIWIRVLGVPGHLLRVLGVPDHLLRVDREAWSRLWHLAEDKRLRIGLEQFGFLFDRAHQVIDSKTLISRFFDL